MNFLQAGSLLAHITHVNLKRAPLLHTDGVHDLGSRAQSGFKVSLFVLPPIPGYPFIPYERWNVETVHMTFTLEKDRLFIQQIDF